jgi:hypothetical protein
MLSGLKNWLFQKFGKCGSIIIFSLVTIQYSSAQKKEPKLFLRGYVKDLVTVNFNDQLNKTFIDNLVHNRLNLNWLPHDNLTIKFEIRNRIFTGDLVQLIPNYSSFIDVDNDYFDLSRTLYESNSLVIHSIIDRAYMQWNKGDWEIRAGRQRINWGKNLVWNPNDIFNTYSFFDFDYEERQGSDAIRIQKYTGVASSIEFAVNLADKWEEITAAGLWKINTSDYDFQVLAGMMKNEWVLGGGWEGSIKNAGFKGEMTYFLPLESAKDNQFLASISVDYSFENSLYLHGSVLYNSEGSPNPIQSNFNNFTTEKLSIKNISPFKYSTFLQASYNLHPLITGGIASIYYPGKGDFFINPSISVSVKQNLDLGLFGQLFYSDNNSQAVFTRLKWSF